MNLRKVKVDKTTRIEKMLKEYLIICLSGMPGVGKKTAVRVLLDKHPEVNAVFCSVNEIETGSALRRADSKRINWYLIRMPEKCIYPESNERLWEFIHKMSKKDRIFLAVEGLLPESFLPLIWDGVMGVVLPETFWFTETETYHYLRECGSSLRYRDVYYLTGGWAGCIAMLVRLENQLRDQWSVWELGNRYEVRKYIQSEILDALPDDELRMLKERAVFPYLNKELVEVLWDDPRRELEEKLFMRGTMIYVPEKECWYVQPALRMTVEPYTSAELCKKAISWYENRGYTQHALTCCWYLRDRQQYRECLIRNYDKVPFLNYEKVGRTEDNLNVPELFYLEWMDAYLRQDVMKMKALRPFVSSVLADSISDSAEEKAKKVEIFLNIIYADPEVTSTKWMELLKNYTDAEHPVRLYFILGESVSYLGGLRDLSELFSCGRKEREEYARLWEERLAPINHIQYRLAELEYEFQTDGAVMRGKHRIDILPEVDEKYPWQVRLGKMYLAYLIVDEEEAKANVQQYIRETADKLQKEENQVCSWNARALLYLAEAKWGEKEKLMRWIRETGGNIENDYGKTKFYVAAEVKINLYLGNFSRAENLLQVLLPYFEKNRSWRWLSEALFQRAVIEKEREENAQALKTVAESMTVANPYRYVKLYAGYGRKGVELLEEYRKWTEKSEPVRYGKKKKYKYGNVLKMPVSDWLDYIIRKAVRQKKYYVDLKEEQQNIYRVEKLTVTEQLVLQYLEKGCANLEISKSMNIKLSTVKTHIYNIYKKLNVTTRIQAVQKARESGML